MLSTREEIFNYLEKISRNFSLQDLKHFTANDISETLNISRNLASQYLNDLVKEKLAIKVNSRPVYFFHKRSVERSSLVTFDTCIFSGLDEFMIKNRSKESKKDFQKAVGHYLSLSPCIEQCKAAIQYPPNGLPVLLYGANGTGKSFLSRLMFEYGKNEKVIGEDKQYIAVDCTEYAGDLENFARSLCGDQKEKGWLARADGGILFFDEIDHLPSAGQELIFSFLISGQYKTFHSNGVCSSGARLIFATSRPPGETLFKAFARQIPIVIPVPSLNERTIDEKEEMLVSFLRREGQRMGVDVSISKRAFHCILEYPFESNIDELKACITSSCAGAYLGKTPEGIAIGTYNLPDYMLSDLKFGTNLEEELIHMNSYNKDTSFEQIVQYFQLILDEYQDFKKGALRFDELLKSCQLHLKGYYDYLIYSQKLVNMKISNYEQMINQIFETVGETYGVSLSRKYSYLLARCLYIQLRADHIVSKWVRSNENEIFSLLQVMRLNLAKESMISAKVAGLVKQNLDVELDNLNQLFLLLNIKSQNESIEVFSTTGIILSHGYSTASSIADAANQIIGKKVFEAIDMPLDMQCQDVARVLEKHIERYVICRDIVLMVDMGSLEQIHRDVRGLTGVNIGIINNISTALAVDIGIGICANKSMEEILKGASENNTCTYRIISNVPKEEAVIFSGENGIGTAEKIKELILASSEACIPVRFIAYDYYRLVKNGSNDQIFSNYRVRCIIGLFNPEIEGVPFIALEDIISMKATEQLNWIFSDYLDQEQMEVFNQNMLKNFTLQNLVEFITILNPGKLLDEVEQSVTRLVRITGRSLEGNIIIGLYVHLCCLVERLVTRAAIENYQDLESFQEKHGDFIGIVKECFQDISTHYKVEFPVSEIAYIYDYINLNLKNKSMNLVPEGRGQDE
ncbi:sigma 54-interacting transcriptional regulator [Lacrimispora sp.]|uniref:sigma 54-interacting transcriptional regulator n=1 Tax=Lacrimispora sp. TaxID=2719234 RepID=UPI00346043E1